MTKILHSKYGYFILVMKGLTEEFFLPKIVYGQFQDGAEFSFSESSVLVTTLLHFSIPVHLRPRLAQTEEIGERANIESDSYSPRKYRFVDDILQINECIENVPATERDRLASIFFVPLRIHNSPFTLIHNDDVFMMQRQIINLLSQNPEARIPEQVTSDLLAVPVYRL